MIRHVHSSSRYDRSPDSLAKAAKRYAKRHGLITWTELEHEHRERAVRKALPHFRHIFGDKSYANDCGISYNPNLYRLLLADHDAATDKRYTNVKGLLRDPAYGTYAVFEEIATSRRFVVAVIHLASSVEDDIKNKRVTMRTVAWFTAFAGFKRRANRLAKAWDADGVALIADWNVDFKKVWVQRLVKALAPSYRLTWNRIPKGGTHGRRLIDATLLRGRLRVRGTALLMKDDNSSDHRPYREQWRWVARRKRA